MLHTYCRALQPFFAEIVVCNSVQRMQMPFVPRSLYGRQMPREDGGPNKDFLTYLFCDQGFATQFLKDVGLLRSKVHQNTCGRHMTWFLKDIGGDVERRFHEASVLSWARGSSSHLTFHQILHIMYDIVRHEPTHHIQKEYVVLAQHPYLLFQVRSRLCRLLLRHFCYVPPPPKRRQVSVIVTDITLSLLLLALAAI